MEQWLENAFDNIDAGLFSSDTFHNEESLIYFEGFIARWQREIKNIRENIPTEAMNKE